MNKKLLIAAVGMALVAGPMMAAQAAPTVYGKMNVGFAKIDNGNAANADSMVVTDDASRLGVTGDEDLGGGLKVIYTWENTLDIDNGGLGSARDAFVGLAGSSWGSVRLGQYNSTYKNLSVPLEVFGDTIGDMSSFGMNGETREANKIGYISPNISGLVFGVESSRGETGLTTESNPSILTASYTAGPLYVGLGIKNMDNQGTTGLDDSKKLVGRFNMDAISVWAIIERQSAKGTLSTTNQELDTNHIGASYKMGNNTIAATITKTGSSATGYDSEAMALGVIHALSKTTQLKFVWTSVDNDTNGTSMGRLSAANASHSLTGTTAGKDPSGIQAQISTAF